MIFVLDNYDSFTFNLVQYIGTLEENIVVKRNDQVNVQDIEKLKPKGIIISPGPKTPKEAGISKDIVSYFHNTTPILGVCLGHQSIAEVFGANIVQAKNVMHGKTSIITTNQKGIFSGLSKSIEVTRYHSLIVDLKTLPSTIEVTAQTVDNIIMGIELKEFRHVWGVQFHPESILTKEGMKMIENFYNLCYS